MVTDAMSHSTLAYVASSGLAATSMIIQTLKSGDHIVTMNDIYGGELLCSNTIIFTLYSTQ